MTIAKIIQAAATATLIASATASAQQSVTGTVVKLDEAAGKIAIQGTQSGTVGSTAGASEEFKVADGLLFNALQPGDKVVFTVTERDGVKTITKLQKQ